MFPLHFLCSLFALVTGHFLAETAICDASCQIILFPVAAPGKFSDQTTIEHTGLLAALDTLPLGSIVVGDAAYTEHLASFDIHVQSVMTFNPYKQSLCLSN